jgi:hypothetical protein
MDKCRGLQRLTGIFASKFIRRQTSQLVVDHGKQLASGTRVARFKPRQELCDFRHVGDYTAIGQLWADPAKNVSTQLDTSALFASFDKPVRCKCGGQLVFGLNAYGLMLEFLNSNDDIELNLKTFVRKAPYSDIGTSAVVPRTGSW